MTATARGGGVRKQIDYNRINMYTYNLIGLDNSNTKVYYYVRLLPYISTYTNDVLVRYAAITHDIKTPV